MKKALLLLMTIFPISGYNLYHDEAKNWLHNFVITQHLEQKITPQEMNLIANLLYFSYQRSKTTLDAQNSALKNLDTLWKGYQNIAQTRLDPSKKAPHPYLQQTNLTKFWSMHDEHIQWNQKYVKIIELLCDVKTNTLFKTECAHTTIFAVRARARAIMLAAMCDLPLIFKELILYFTDTPRKSTAKKGWFASFWEQLPHVSANSFAQTDKFQIAVSEDAWLILKKTQDVHGAIWHAIETARAEFYATYYQELYEAMLYLDLEVPLMKVSFNENGYIQEEDRTQLLPESLL